jgi:hypothetical protein
MVAVHAQLAMRWRQDKTNLPLREVDYTQFAANIRINATPFLERNLGEDGEKNPALHNFPGCNR